MPRSVVDPRFRAVLANLMMAAGMRQARLAKLANVSQSHLSQIINGERNPSEQVARALDEALDAKGQLADLVVIGAHPDDIDRLAAAAANPRRIGFATLESLARVLAGQRHLDDLMGSTVLLGPTLAQMHLITTMAGEAVGPDRSGVLYEAGQWAEFCAWLHISVGKMTEARTWLARSLEWAMELGDVDLIATVLSYQAHVSWLQLQRGPAIGLAEAALRDERVYPGQRAYDAYAAARGYAALGDLREADRLRGLADELAEVSNTWTGQLPPWQYYRAPWFWQLERGLVDLYKARWNRNYAALAISDLAGGVEAMPDEWSGADWAAEYLTHLATAHRTAGERDEARTVLSRARMIAEATASPRVLQIVSSAERTLRIDERGY
jgi:transcriptional regulator with XRE-family HTH domain